MLPTLQRQIEKFYSPTFQCKQMCSCRSKSNLYHFTLFFSIPILFHAKCCFFLYISLLHCPCFFLPFVFISMFGCCRSHHQVDESALASYKFSTLVLVSWRSLQKSFASKKFSYEPPTIILSLVAQFLVQAMRLYSLSY